MRFINGLLGIPAIIFAGPVVGSYAIYVGKNLAEDGSVLIGGSAFIAP